MTITNMFLVIVLSLASTLKQMPIFFIYYTIIFILQIILLYQRKKRLEDKYWKAFIGSFWAIIVSLPFAYTYSSFYISLDEASDLGDAITLILWTGMTFMAYVLLGIIGLVMEKKAKKQTLSASSNTQIKSKHFGRIVFIATIFVFFICLLLSNIITHIYDKNLNHNIEYATLEYLNNKYGNCNFNVVEIKKDIGYNGIIDSYLTGYTIIVSSNLISDEFCVNTGTDYASFSDNFILSYYDDYFSNDENNEKANQLSQNIAEKIANLNDYLNKYVNVSIDVSELTTTHTNSYLASCVPDNYGKVPSIDELYALAEDYIFYNELRLHVDDNEIDSKLYSIEEAEEVLDSLPLDPKYKYYISGLTVYRNDEIFKKYSSEEDLLNRLNKDLNTFGVSHVPQIKSRLTSYYEAIAKYIIAYDPSVSYFDLTCNYSGAGLYQRIHCN